MSGSHGDWEYKSDPAKQATTNQPSMTGWLHVPSAVTVTSVLYSGLYSLISSESDKPVVPSVTVAETPDGALTTTAV